MAGLSVESGNSLELVDTVNSVLKQKHFNLLSGRCMKLQETWDTINYCDDSSQ